MAQDASIKLTLDTSELLKEAQKVAPTLEKALSVKNVIPSVEKYQTELHKAAESAKILDDKTGNLAKNFNTKSLDKYTKDLQEAVSLADQLQQVNAKLAELGVNPEKSSKETLASFRGKIGSAAKKGPDEKQAALDNYNSVKELLDLQGYLQGELTKQESILNDINEKAAKIVNVAYKHETAVNKVNTAYDKIRDSLSDDATKQEQVADGVEDTTNKLKNEAKAADDATQSIENLGNAQKEIKEEQSQPVPKAQDTTPDVTTGSIGEDTKNASAEAKNALGPIAQLVSEIYRLKEAGEDTTSQLTALQTKLAETFSPTASEGELNYYLKQIDEAIKFVNSDLDHTSKLADVFTVLSRATAPAKAAFSELNAEAKKLGTGGVANGAEEAIKQAQQTAARMQNAIRVGIGEGGIAELTRRLNDLKQAKKSLDDLGIPAKTTQTYNQLVSQIAQVEGEIKKYKQNMNEASSSGDKMSKSAKKVGSSVAAGFKGLPNIAEAAKKGFKSLSSIIGTVKKGFSSLSGVTNKIKSSFGGMASNMRSNFKHMITNITKYVLGFRSLFFLVRRLRKYIGEGIQSMAKFNSGNNPVNANISKLITSLEFLKNAWATAFDPILQVVTPMLTGLIDKLAEVGNSFSRFLGNLLGVSKVFQAVKGPTKNYAKSLDKTGKSAGGAAKKQKKLNDRLADFDDLHVLGKDNDSPSSGGGSGSGNDDADKKRNNKLWDFAKLGKDLQKSLKDMWANADFTTLGKKLSDGIYNALNNIKWDKIKTVAAKVGKSLATFLNGALGDPKLWSISGSTVAEIVNTIGSSINSFLKNIKVDFGGGFATLINSFFKTVDWGQVNENIKLFGDQLVKNINSFFKTLDLSKISMDLGGLAQSLTSVLVSLIDDIDWKQVGNAFLSFGNAVSEGIENALKGSNNPLIKVLSDTLSTIRQSANDLLPVIGQIMSSVGQAIQAILPALSAALPSIVSLIQQIATTVLPVLVSAIQTLTPILSQIISTILPVLSQVLTALSPIFTTLAKTLLPAIASAISQLLPVITPIITQLVSMLVPVLTNLVTTLLPVLQGIFNAILPILQQILPIIMSIVQTLLPVFSQILAQIMPTIQQVTEAILPIVVKLLDIIAPLISDILTALSDLVGPVLGLLGPILESITSTIGPLLDIVRPIVNIVRVLLNLVVSILQPIIELIEPIMKIINDCLSPIFSLFGLIGTALETIIVPLLKLLAGVIQTIVLPILKLLVAGVKLIVDAFGNVSTAVNFVIGLFKLGFEQLGKWFKGFVNGFLDGVGGFINGFIKALNAGIRGINKLAIDIPDWVPVVGGKKLGFNIKELNTINIPKLAQGAVIPPNNEFMAVLGDQSHGTNIEAPLDTIKQAVAEVLANNNNQEVIRLLQQLIGVVESKNLVIGDKEIGKANARYTNQQKLIRGTSF